MSKKKAWIETHREGYPPFISPTRFVGKDDCKQSRDELKELIKAYIDSAIGKKHIYILTFLLSFSIAVIGSLATYILQNILLKK